MEIQMKSVFNKMTSTAAGVVVFLVGCALAGLGFTVLAFFAMFALAAYGLALIAAPFVELAMKTEDASEFEDISTTQTAA